MNRLVLIFLILVLTATISFAGDVLPKEKGDTPVFGPVKYDVLKRYGEDNRSVIQLNVPEGWYMIKLQNGVTLAQRTDLLRFSINGEKLLAEDTYLYQYLLCFVKLEKENTLELSIKDYTPSGFKRPAAIPKNLTLTVLPAPFAIHKTVIGLMSLNALNEYATALAKITSPESMALALASISLQYDTKTRTESLRNLSVRKDPATQDLMLTLLNSPVETAEVRGEAALSLGLLGNTASIPSLITGVFDPEELVRIGAARSLAMYNERDTQEPLEKALERMDSIMRGASVRSIVSAGWKPVSTLIHLAQSQDPAIANSGVELLTGVKDERVVDLMLKLLDAPEQRNIRIILLTLAETKSNRAANALIQFSTELKRRKGKEIELTAALVSTGDPDADRVAREIIKKTDNVHLRNRLIEVYKRVSGKEYNP